MVKTPDSICNSNRHLESIKFALNVISQSEYAKQITDIYLYGSCARNEQKYTSDVDLFICTDGTMDSKIKRELKNNVTPNYQLPEVELMFGEKNSISFSRQFTENVRRDGVLIWSRE